jgi:hypothetical protein
VTHWLHVTHVFAIRGVWLIIHPHGTDCCLLSNERIPEACAYTYQRYPASVKEGLPPSFPHGLSELNGGLQIFKPSRAKFEKIYSVLINSAPSEFLFADQSLLSKAFHNEWEPLYLSLWVLLMRPFIYNALKTLRSAHPPIWKDEEVKNVHYILAKPWDDGGKGKGSEETHMWWWEVDEERQIKEKEIGLLEPSWN